MTRVRSGGPSGIARLFLSVLMICTAYGAASAEEKNILASELLANPDKYEGKHVVLRGYVIIRPKARFLCDSKRPAKVGSKQCANDEVDGVVDQARDYSAEFEGGVIYYTNSVEFADYYTKIFHENGIEKFKFVIVPVEYP